jgi:hypothetical protein
MGGKLALPNEHSFSPGIQQNQKQYSYEYKHINEITIVGLLVYTMAKASPPTKKHRHRKDP